MSGEAGQLGLGIVGAAAGFLIGGPTGAYWGFIAGSVLGSVVFPTQLPGIQQQGPRLDDLKIQSSAYGQGLPILFGTVRCAGVMIWSQPITEHVNTHTEEVGGKGGPSQEITTTTYSYTISCAISVSEGPIIGIRRIWANKELIYDAGEDIDFASSTAANALNDHMRVYLGTETQDADPLIVASEGNAPAYRGTAYVLFDTLDLAPFYNRIPNFEFEVVASGTRTVPNFRAIDYTPTQVNGGWSATGATWVSGSVTPDGLILAALGKSSGNARLALINPYTGQVIREYPYEQFISGTKNDISPSQFDVPVMNARGDIAWKAVSKVWAWREGGAPVEAIGFNPHTGVEVDSDGYFYAAGGSPDGLRRFDASGGQQLVQAGFMHAIFDSRDGYIWAAQTQPLPILKIKKPGGVAAQYAAPRQAITLAVAGDGSLWYMDDLKSLYRVSPDLSSSTLIWSEPAGDIEETNARLARDWASGDILHNQGPGAGDVWRYAADGTVLQSYTGGDSISRLSSNADYPALIAGFSGFTNSPGGLMFVEYAATLEREQQPVAEVIASLCARVGVAPEEIDVSGLTALLRGYVIANRAPVRGGLEPLLTAFSLDGVENGEKIRFFERGVASLVTIPEDDMGAAIDGGEAVDPVTIQRTQEPELPHEIAITHIDYARDYLPGTQYARRLVQASANDTQMNMAVVMTPNEANELATTMLYESWAGRMRYALPVSQRYARYEPGDVLTLRLASGDAVVRMVQAQSDAGVINAQAISYDPTYYTQSANAPTGPIPEGGVQAPGPTNLVLLDTALLREQDDAYGLYAAAGGYTEGWNAAQLYKSSDQGQTYVPTGDGFIDAAAIGHAATKLGDFKGGNVFDELNSVRVNLITGQLSSTTEANVLGGANACYLAGEILTFKNAVLVSDKVYDLSGFLRGRNGTEWAMGRHGIGDQFVLLTPGQVINVGAPSTDVGIERLYKAPHAGTALVNASTKPLVLAANRLKPLAPVQVGGGRNAAGDVLIDWIRRARKAASWQNNIDVPLDEPSLAYEVDVYAGAGITVLGISAAMPAVVTSSGAHGLAVGNPVHLSGVSGALGSAINGAVYTVAAVVDATHVSLAGLNTVGLAAWSGGGVLRKAARTLTATTETVTYTAALQTTDYGGLQATIHVAVYQMSSRVGRGYPGVATI